MGHPGIEEVGEYFMRYVRLVPEGGIVDVLRAQSEETRRLFGALTDEQSDRRYEAGKWSLKEVLGHVLDTERIMAYRLLAFARGEQKTLPGFDQDDYVRQAGFGNRAMRELLAEYAAVREATLALLAGLPEEAWTRKGRANNAEVSVRGLAYVMAGHERHHLNVVREKYLA